MCNLVPGNSYPVNLPFCFELRQTSLTCVIVVTLLRKLGSDRLTARHLVITMFAHAQGFHCCIARLVLLTHSRLKKAFTNLITSKI